MTDAVVWDAGGIVLVVDAPPDRFPSLRILRSTSASTSTPPGAGGIPIAEIRVGGEAGSLATSERMMGSRLSRRLRMVSHHADGDSGLTITSRDPVTGLRVTSRFETSDAATIRAWTEVCNEGDRALTLHQVSSLAVGGLSTPGSPWWTDRLSLAQNTWFREVMWQTRTLAEHGVDDVGLRQWGYRSSRAVVAVGAAGTWSSGGHLPMGMLAANDDRRVLAWQIEHNGPWRWEVGDDEDSTYLVASGPTDPFHAWSHRLEPGETFVSVPAALAVGATSDETLGALTTHRRSIRRPHPDTTALPVVFNDFMNCLMGDPSTEKLLPLVAAAADAGAETFCIDAGWYADDGEWWDTVGEWLPARHRFPGGIEEVMTAIRDAGMVPGLWLEPESVGIRSRAADRLPREAFFQRDGERVIEAARYRLDFRHPAAIAHLDAVVDRIVEDYGVGYLKLDDNIDVTLGTDVASSSAGDGGLGHARAYLAWIDRVLERHPGLVLENCASGGQRMDYAMLARHQVQSLTDNQDPLRSAAIAAAAPSAVTPEQAGIWVYPQSDWSDELIAFNVVGAMLGRVQLSGRIDLLDSRQQALVRAGIGTYKSFRERLPTGLPFWPLGLPGWHDDWLALGILTDDEALLAVWRRGGPTARAIPLEMSLRSVPELVYPPFPTQRDWSEGILTVEFPGEPAARLYRFRRA